MTIEDVEDTSGGGEQERWFGEKGRHESNKMENGSQRVCCCGKFGHTHLWGYWYDDDEKLPGKLALTTIKALRRNPIEDGAISGFSGQKSVPE